MAVNSSGGIDVTDSFVKGFSAIANVNLKRQALNLEAAQMVQNYNLKQQEMEHEAQFLPIRYQTAYAAQQAAKTRAESALLSQKRLMEDQAKVESDGIGFQRATDGVDITTPEGLKTHINAAARFRYAKYSPNVVGLLGRLKELNPQSVQEIDNLFQSSSDMRVTRETRKNPYGGTTTLETAKPQSALRPSEQFNDLAAKMFQSGLDPSNLTARTIKNASGRIVVKVPDPKNPDKFITKGSSVEESLWNQWKAESERISRGEQAQGAVDFKAIAQQALDDPEATPEEKAKARRILGQ